MFDLALYGPLERRHRRALSRHVRILHCDYGPARWTGKRIDITGLGVLALGYSPGSYPTGVWGVARELR